MFTSRIPREPPLTALQAEAVRAALARVAAGETAPSDSALPPETRRLLDRLQAELAAAAVRPGDAADRLRAPAHAVLVGVDRLAAIKDLGTGSAERIIATLSARIREALPGAVLRRTGRGVLEFVFDCEPGEAAGRLAALQEALQARIAFDGQVFELPVAIGYARAEPGAPADAALAEAAEEALAHARAAHLAVAEFDEAARARRSDRATLMRDLRAALAADALHLVYQPKLEARTGRIAAVEALVRWRHPERGLVPPDLFVTLAEQTGEIRALTERVLRRAVADQAAMAAAGCALAVDVNLSGVLLCDDAFAAWVLECVAGAVGPIGLEITETAAIADAERAIAHMRAFADAGVHIALDDYGSGLSSLSYLKRLPAHELKIDKAFVLGLTSSPRDPLIIRSTVELAHALEMTVTAEGVDDPAARALLTVMGCDRLQGYGIAPPLAPDDLMAFLAAREECAPAPRPALFAANGRARLQAVG